MNKIYLALTLFLITLITNGCTSAERAVVQQVTQQNIQPEIIPPPTPEKTTSPLPSTPPTERPLQTFTMTASRWSFTPNSISVEKGDRVKITITSTDVDHGFAIPAFGVNVRVNKGETKTVEFLADKLGTFTYACSVYCGSGHSAMKGILVVNE